jgi:hypothetical protein
MRDRVGFCLAQPLAVRLRSAQLPMDADDILELAGKGDLEGLKKELAETADWATVLDGDKTTLLHAGAGSGSLELVKFLVETKKFSVLAEDK